jgi:endoglucanase
MPRFRRTLTCLSILLGVALVPAAAQADPSGIQFSADNYSVHEYSGVATITVVRGDTSQEAHADYIAVGLGHPCGGQDCTATPPDNGVGVDHTPADFRATKGQLDFAPGQSSASFDVPIVDHHFQTIDKTVSVGIFAAWPQGTAGRDHAVLTILGDDSTPARDPANPLMLPVPPTNGDPLSGARLFVDPDSKVAWAARQNPGLNVIAGQPGASRYGTFTGKDPAIAVNRFLVRADAQGPGTVPMLSTYKLVDYHCGQWTPTAANVADYHFFITRLAQGIGSHSAVMFLEGDSLITVGCLSAQGVSVRTGELNFAIDTLNALCPHLVIYMDAGAADALSAKHVANLLNRAGVSKIEGFFLNATHFDWTSREIAYGEQVSRLTGGKHFVINTGSGGRGPLVPADPVHQGNEVLCNPAGRGLGPKPTTNPGYRNVDAFEWMMDPGESGGQCVPGAPPTGDYWAAYGLMLVHNAGYTVDNAVNVSQWATGAAARSSRAHTGKPNHKRHKAHKPVHKHAKRKHAKRTHAKRTHAKRKHAKRVYARMA